MIGLGAGIFAWRPSGSAALPPPPPPPSVLTAIASDGWRASWPTPPASVSPMAETLAVTRQGFDGTGTASAPVDSVGVLSRVRLPYPDQATLTADQVSLSDFIYAGDTIAGVTNTSTRAYPKPIALWLNHDLERAAGTTHMLRLAVAHGHARQGRPVAAVRFVVTDGVNTVTQTVNTTAQITYASGLSVPHFAANMDLSTLATGVLLTVDAVIYPWVGAAFTISTDADPYPSPNLTTLRLLNDRDGSYGTVYAYVDAVAGDNATGVAATTPATAQPAPFLTIAGAVTAIRAANKASFGRENAGGGVVRLVEGVHNSSPFRSAAGTPAIPVVIEAANPAAKATTVYLGPTANTQSSIPDKTEFRNITIRKQGGSIIFLDGANSVTGLLVFKGCILDNNGTSSYAAFVYRVGRLFLHECEGSVGQANTFSTAYKIVTAIGCPSGGMGAATYHAVACRGGYFAVQAAASPRPAATGAFCGWNVFSKGAGSGVIVGCKTTVGPRGIAVVGNVIEGWGAFTDPLVQINADSDISPTENVVVQMNTCVGERTNLLYLDSTSNLDKSGYISFNVFELMNIKSDLFSTNGANVGNWPARYKVGWRGNMAFRGSNNGGGYGPVPWTGEISGRDEVSVAAAPFPDMAWADDRSNLGADTGGGDYTPGAGTAVISLPAGMAPYGIDLKGVAVRNDGTGVIGAQQRA